MVSFSIAGKIFLALPSFVVGTNYPIGITNCHISSWIHEAPERVVVASSGAVEIMLSLGLADKIQASCWVKEVWAPLAEDFDKFRHYPKYPNHTELEALDPDFMYASYSSAFDLSRINYTDMLGIEECELTIPTNVYGDNKTYCRQELEDAGIGTFLGVSYCELSEYRPESMDIQVLFQEVTDIGAIFDVQEKAQEMISDIKEDFDLAIGISQASSNSVGDADPIRVLWFDMWNSTSGTNPTPDDPMPYVGACCGGPQIILDHAGAKNIYEDLGTETRRSWDYVTYDAMGASDPDLIVLVDLSTESAAKKLYLLCKDNRTRGMRAVQERQFIVVPFAASNIGVRLGVMAYNLAEAISALAHGNHLNALQFTADPEAGLAYSLSGAKIWTTLPKYNDTDDGLIDLETFCPGSNKEIEIKGDNDEPDDPLEIKDITEDDSGDDDKLPNWAVGTLWGVGVLAGVLFFSLLILVNREQSGDPMFAPIKAGEAS